MREFKLLSTIEKERNLRLKGRFIIDPHADLLWNKALSLTNATNKTKLLEAYNFARKIKYDHEGLSSTIYFAHPIRVASLAMLYYDEINLDLGILGLIHKL